MGPGNRFSRRTGRATGAAAVLAASVVVAAVPHGASAGAETTLTGFHVAKNSTEKTSSQSKRVKAKCEPGEFNFGGGAFVTKAPELAITQIGGGTNLAGPFSAAETDPTTKAWNLRAQTYCLSAGPAAPVDGSSAQLVKDILVVSSGLSSSSTRKKLRVNCPGGRRPISGGASLSDDVDVGLTSLRRVKEPFGYAIKAQKLDSFDGAWSAAALAVCANITTETNTSDYASGPHSGGFVTPLNSVGMKATSATCPPGDVVLGGYATVMGEDDGPPPPGVVITESAPAATGDAVNDWDAAARESDPTDENWKLGVYVRCAEMDLGPPA